MLYLARPVRSSPAGARCAAHGARITTGEDSIHPPREPPDDSLGWPRELSNDSPAS
jgi:hypothetical protein